VIAMFNKESSLLMAAWFVPWLFNQRPRTHFVDLMSKKSAALHLVLHSTIGLPILGWLYWYYRENGGGPVEWHLIDNLRSYLEPSTYLHMVDIYSAGIPMPQGFHVVNLLLFGFLLFHGWKHKSGIIRISFVASVLSVLPLFVAFGYRDEVRVFDLAFPAAFLLGTDTMMRLWSEQRNPA